MFEYFLDKRMRLTLVRLEVASIKVSLRKFRVANADTRNICCRGVL
jgi:hypothetical protein